MPKDDSSKPFILITLVVLIILAGVVTLFVLRQHHAAHPTARGARTALNAEQKAYLPSLVFADLRMSAAVNFLGDTVTYLDGSVTNQGAKQVRRLEVELNFVDTLNQVVLRETAYPLASRTTPLQPGETQAFRVSFDHMPMDWNQAPPSIKPTYVDF